MSDPFTILLLAGGAIGAISSLVSAISSYAIRRGKLKTTVKIGNQEIKISTDNRTEVEQAVERLQQVLNKDRDSGV